MANLLKNLVFFTLNLFITRQTGPSILMYHSVGATRSFLSVKPENFERQMAWLKQKGFKTVFLSELVEKLKYKDACAKKIVALTFDDGYLDNYQVALPILKKYQIKATVFLISGRLSGEWTNNQKISLPLLGRPEIKAMLQSGWFEFLPHGASHRDLTLLNQPAIYEETENSRRGG